MLRYEEFPPSPRFSRHIECFWVHRSAGREPNHCVLPDGSMDILFERSPNKVGVAALRIIGAMTRAQSCVIPPRHVTLGARFRPGMAARALGVPYEVWMESLPSKTPWGAAAGRRLREQLDESHSPQEFISRLGHAGRTLTDPIEELPRTGSTEIEPGYQWTGPAHGLFRRSGCVCLRQYRPHAQPSCASAFRYAITPRQAPRRRLRPPSLSVRLLTTGNAPHREFTQCSASPAELTSTHHL